MRIYILVLSGKNNFAIRQVIVLDEAMALPRFPSEILNYQLPRRRDVDGWQ